MNVNPWQWTQEFRAFLIIPRSHVLSYIDNWRPRNDVSLSTFRRFLQFFPFSRAWEHLRALSLEAFLVLQRSQYVMASQRIIITHWPSTHIPSADVNAEPWLAAHYRRWKPCPIPASIFFGFLVKYAITLCPQHCIVILLHILGGSKKQAICPHPHALAISNKSHSFHIIRARHSWIA